ncbi:alpha-glucuronidase [Marinilongibacter aquaticus]|uniref:alpha-glucuronidase family glycosyl hydrolase n=1 Tax=Marinilongibacter aquaticus TaxID=2975157 RepID=UPI0021BDDF5B|nr:alpha-glucuronidase family glycosyl hydrolase [Marinilongibacter aquaticus]UBM57738.1 alpha-glucuronidase [Marinilongibacter aquaticus]
MNKTTKPNLLKKALLFFAVLLSGQTYADDGGRLWLKYDLIADQAVRENYAKSFDKIVLLEHSERIILAAEELQVALKGLLGKDVPIEDFSERPKEKHKNAILLMLDQDNTKLETDGYALFCKNGLAMISAQNDLGVLYGVFGLLRKIQTEQTLDCDEVENPKIRWRMLNHWDNANGTVERGYAGSSIWKWFELPERIDPRIVQYARANASIGINAVSINNVNASARFLTAEYLRKIKGVADVLRPYGIKVFISVNFKAPKTLGGLETSDPLDEGVKNWWQEKTEEIYSYIPDFGGYLVKANSEGEPGPQDYGRTHADGANMLAEAMKGHDGIVVWRAFVYNADPNGDRFEEANKQFKPLDGQFDDKVIVQVKNGPIDFMPREPFHPMFGQFPKTQLGIEFQITQEYLGHATHLIYLAPMFKECLDSDTYAKGKGSTVGRVVDGSLYQQKQTLMAGVANTGSDANWTGHPFGQANWYAFGRLAWDHTLSAEQIAQEWTGMTLTNKKNPEKEIVDIMMASLPTYINYTYPLGLHHMMGEGHHYGPQPWLAKSGRPDWTSVYYHRAGKDGIGFDRSGGMSKALKLYAPEVQKKWGNPATCDLNYLMWFHHLPWNYKLTTGRTLWDELMTRYYLGVEQVKDFENRWHNLKGQIDNAFYENVNSRLKIQEREAKWWRDACYLYFEQFSGLPLPKGLQPPKRTLEEVKALEKVYHLR